MKKYIPIFRFCLIYTSLLLVVLILNHWVEFIDKGVNYSSRVPVYFFIALCITICGIIRLTEIERS